MTEDKENKSNNVSAIERHHTTKTTRLKKIDSIGWKRCSGMTMDAENAICLGMSTQSRTKDINEAKYSISRFFHLKCTITCSFLDVLQTR